MKTTLEISNDLEIPLTNANVEWNLYLYKKRYRHNLIDLYDMYRINSIPLSNIYSEIHLYISRNFINKIDITNYSAEMPRDKIGFIDLSDENNMLKNPLRLINDGIAHSDLFSSNNISSHGYIIECKIEGQPYLQIFSTSNPIKIYKHKYSVLFNKFNEITEPILSLNHTCDCIIKNNDYALFFTGRAENIFDLEKHYKALANKSLNFLRNSNLFEDFDSFANYSSVWPKAAKFETFSEERIQQFASLTATRRAEILNTFNISVNANGAIVTNSPEAQENVLKFICGKFLTDFDDEPYEVFYPQKINHH